MQEVSTTTVSFPSTSSRDALTEVLRSGAQRLLAEAIEAEVAEWIDSHAHRSVQIECQRRNRVGSRRPNRESPTKT
jgi:siroheme synthase (precorrin-2 oxidase/ferrochelatase)